MNELFTFQELRNQIVNKKNRNYRSKSVFNYVPFLLGDVVANPRDYIIEKEDMSSVLDEMDDNSRMKIFTSFIHSNFPKDIIEDSIMEENIWAFIIYAYYFTAYDKPLLIPHINRIINFDMIKSKIKSYYPSYTESDERKIMDHIYVTRFECLTSLSEYWLVEKSILYNLLDDDKSSEDELITKIEYETNEFIKWAYEIWKLTKYFYGTDEETVKFMYESVISDLKNGFIMTVEFFFDSVERGWFFVDMVNNFLESEENGIFDKIEELKRKDEIIARTECERKWKRI